MVSFHFSDLNPAQQAAVLHTEGPCLVIAGPGSGKTHVLIHRVAHLIAEKHISPTQIMVLTFTKKAAEAMKKRLFTLIGNQMRPLWIGTFHSVFSRILRREVERLDLGLTSAFSIYDTSDSKSLIKRICKELKLTDDYKPKALLLHISRCKRAGVDATTYEEDEMSQKEDERKKIPLFYSVYQHYEARCRRANAMDYDDLLFYTYLLFCTHPEVLAHYQARFQYVLADEFQDTDQMQYHIMQQLVAQHQNLCVIGDDAQSIYSFRGAEIKHILSFPKQFPKAKLFKLEQNYRSTKHIVNAANGLIKHNKQYVKTLFTNNKTGDKIELYSLLNDLEEANFVIDHIHTSHKERDTSYDDIAILYRKNSQSRVLEEALMQKKIPYQVIGGISFYDRKEIKDLLAYLYLIVNPTHEEALQRAINYPKRAVGQVTLQKIRTHAMAHNSTMWQSIINVSTWMQGKVAMAIHAFGLLIENHRHLLTTHNAYDITQSMLHKSGLWKLIQQDTSEEGQTRLENMEEMLKSIDLFCKKNPESATLTAFLEEISLATSGDEKEEKETLKVKLMTMHKAKGLEFRHVYIVGIIERLFFNSFFVTPATIEEERRLFFVALTRAKENLVLTYAENSYEHGNLHASRPCRFLGELNPKTLLFPQKIPQCAPPNPSSLPYKPHYATRRKTVSSTTNNAKAFYEVGNSLMHPSFGKGKIIAVSFQDHYKKIIVDFPQKGRRTLLMGKVSVK